MKKVILILFTAISLSFVTQQKETAMLYIITTSKELGSSKTRNDLSNQMFIIPKSLEIDRRKFLNDKLTSLRSKHTAVQFREKSLHLNSGDYLCIATAHLVHDKSDVGKYQRFYFVVSSNKDDIKAKAEKDVLLFVNKKHLDHITYDVSQPFLPEERNYWREWYNGLREWLNEEATEEDKKKFEEFNKKKTPKATGGVRG
jgi:hypothetical protein